MTFNFKFLYFTCLCGKQNAEATIASCSDYHLMFVWVCPNCSRTVRARVPFEDLIRGVPSPPEPVTITKEDKDFLKELHISL